MRNIGHGRYLGRATKALGSRARRLAERYDPVPPAPEPEPAQFARSLAPGPLGCDRHPASRIIYERLSESDVVEVEALLRTDAGIAYLLDDADTPERRRYVMLAFGLLKGSEPVLLRTGLTAVQPPDDIHSVARGPLSAAGGTYEADMVAGALESVGVDPASLEAALDFGGSSGRVVRVLAAAYDEVRWMSCDPNRDAVAWAAGALPGIEFFVSGDEPPLPLEAQSLDFVYAISVWSHFAPALGLRWIEEMRRVLKPGGHLLLTTHGLTTVGFEVAHGYRPPIMAQEIREALYRDGSWYMATFGEQGDWGVVNPNWGTAFLSAEWLLAKVLPAWRLVEYAPGRNSDNQDLYLLQRK